MKIIKRIINVTMIFLALIISVIPTIVLFLIAPFEFVFNYVVFEKVNEKSLWKRFSEFLPEFVIEKLWI